MSDSLREIEKLRPGLLRAESILLGLDFMGSSEADPSQYRKAIKDALAGINQALDEEAADGMRKMGFKHQDASQAAQVNLVDMDAVLEKCASIADRWNANEMSRRIAAEIRALKTSKPVADDGKRDHAQAPDKEREA